MSGDDDLAQDRSGRAPIAVRAAPLVIGATFIVIGAVALGVNPDGFGQRSIAVAVLATVLLVAGGFLAAVTHLASRND
jgi:DMSO reductase anchor subunit